MSKKDKDKLRLNEMSGEGTSAGGRCDCALS